MPTYGYECLSCGRSFETFQRITDDTLTTCDVCQGALRKKIFPVGIVFKGSGFYVNDYAKKTSSGDEAVAAKTEPSVADTAKPVEPAATAEANSSEAKPAETTPAAPAPASPVSSTPTAST